MDTTYIVIYITTSNISAHIYDVTYKREREISTLKQLQNNCKIKSSIKQNQLITSYWEKKRLSYVKS